MSKQIEEGTQPDINNGNIASIEAKKHIEQNIVPVGRGLKCIDGRDETQASMMAQPGAFLGDLTAIMAWIKAHDIGWTPEQIVDKLTDAVVTIDGAIYFHTDNHSPLQEGLSQGKFMVTTLNGEHKEKGGLVVTGKRMTICSHDRSLNSMYFVFNKTLAEERRKQLVQALKIDGLTYQDLTPYYDYQLESTLGLLAGGLPIFEVNVDNISFPEVTYKGRTKKIETAPADHHAIIGCGHFAKAVQYPELYRVDGKKLEDCLEYLKERFSH